MGNISGGNGDISSFGGDDSISAGIMEGLGFGKKVYSIKKIKIGADRYEGNVLTTTKNDSTGTIKEDVMDGFGIYYYKDGSRFEGYFKKNKRHGNGVFYDTRGGEKVGYWMNDEEVRSTYTPPAESDTLNDLEVEIVSENRSEGRSSSNPNIPKSKEVGDLRLPKKPKKESTTKKEPKKDDIDHRHLSPPRKRGRGLEICFDVSNSEEPRYFLDTDSADLVVKTYQRSKGNFSVKSIYIVDSDDLVVEEDDRIEYKLDMGCDVILKRHKVAFKRKYVVIRTG